MISIPSRSREVKRDLAMANYFLNSAYPFAIKLLGNGYALFKK